MREALAKMVSRNPGVDWPSEGRAEGYDRIRDFFLDAFKNRIDPKLCRILSA